ncbi:UPF0496 protein At3g48650 [Arabidopsis lyrata subsp. lyrata]|nr:UPF0496 protein At3g48650 [Arabidopsis lyrata subsp. lyrata]|eukprot:XP_020882621.1 UPF0496 protein At3g48650 [Arabidopsis lyrata subsp. lyrata]
MGDPFGDEFTTQYKAIFDEHLMLLNKSRDMQLELEKKHKNDKKSRRFAAALFSVLAIWIYLGAVSLVVAAKVVIGVATPSIRPLWKWVTEMLEDSEIAYKKLTGLFQSMDKNAKLNIESAKTIKSLVETLITRIKPILETVDDAVEQREEETVKLVMQEIIKDVEGFADKIEEVGTNVARCSKVVAEGRVDVLEHISNLA